MLQYINNFKLCYILNVHKNSLFILTKLKLHSFLIFTFLPLFVSAQLNRDENPNFFEPVDSFHKSRFYTTLSAGVVGYSATMYGLNNIWFKNSKTTSFYFYNDWYEWRNMDKFGHAYTAYMETDLIHRMARWTGIPDRKSMWLAAGAANMFQLSIEVLDGFNEKWGFSFWDLGFNVGGSALYVGQELLWDEQRIRLKYSVYPRSYSNDIVPSLNNIGNQTYKERASQLYGNGLASRILKDYNGQTYWLSINPSKFNIPHPDWLNWSFGISVENIYGGYSNQWINEGVQYNPTSPRKTVLYFSPDINWTAFKGENSFINTIFHLLNYLKTPAPAVSLDTNGNLGWYIVVF